MSKKNKKIEEQKMSKKIEEQEPKKTYLRSSDQLINRIRWDSAFDKNLLVIGYLDRFVGLQFCNLEEFDIGDIPFHRIVLLKYDDKVVWDREKKIDLITTLRSEDLVDGKLVEHKKEYSEQEEQERKTEIKQEEQIIQQEIEELKEIKVEKEELKEIKKEIEGSTKTEPVTPLTPNTRNYDSFELWVYENSDKELFRNNPTHISQLGGYYHISKNLKNDFFRNWSIALQTEEPFFLKEVIPPTFRLFIDIDINLMDKTPYNIVKNGWIPDITNVTLSFFKDCNPTFLLTKCHGDYTEEFSYCVYKSGFNLYFPFIYVDSPTLIEFTTVLRKELAKKHTIEKLSSELKFEDVIDQDFKSSTRLFGSNKSKFKKDIGRKYEFVGVFGENGIIDKITNNLKENPFELVQFTSVLMSEKSENCRIFEGMLYTKDESKKIEIFISAPDWFEEEKKEDWLKF